MRWFNSNKEKDRPLEEIAKEMGISYGKPSDENYIAMIVKASDLNIKAAQIRLLRNARDKGVKYLDNISQPDKRSKRISTTYLITAVGYAPKTPRAA